MNCTKTSALALRWSAWKRGLSATDHHFDGYMAECAPGVCAEGRKGRPVSRRCVAPPLRLHPDPAASVVRICTVAVDRHSADDRGLRRLMTYPRRGRSRSPGRPQQPMRSSDMAAAFALQAVGRARRVPLMSFLLIRASLYGPEDVPRLASTKRFDERYAQLFFHLSLHHLNYCE